VEGELVDVSCDGGVDPALHPPANMLAQRITAKLMMPREQALRWLSDSDPSVISAR